MMPAFIRDNVRELGWRDTGWYFLRRALGAVSAGRITLYRYYFVAQPVATSDQLPPGRGRTLQVGDVSVGDATVALFPRPPEVLRDRYRQDARCLAALRDGAFAGFLWFVIGPYEEDEVRARFVPLPEGRCAWDFDAHVEPKFRLGPTFLKLWDEANRRFREAGVAWSLSRISAFNRGSLAAHRRLGTELLGSAVFIGLGRCQLMLSSVAPHVHLSLHAGSRPELRLAPRPGRGIP
jgi:hypothetical protein